jgi:hypothetical protein
VTALGGGRSHPGKLKVLVRQSYPSGCYLYAAWFAPDGYRSRAKVLCPRYPARLLRGQLCDLARDKTGATGEHTGRRLRELTEEGILEVQYRRGHAFYRLKEAVPQLFQ